MAQHGFKQIYETILDVIEPRLSEAGFDRATIEPETDLSSFIDSFGLLETIMDIEERAGVSADLGEMDFAKAMTIGGLASEIIRINS